MSEKYDVDELLKKAERPSKEALVLHPFYEGKIEVVPKCVVRSMDDFSLWYTPGVAAPCKEIAEDIEKVFEHTNKANMIAVITDGTRVLGLGDIGPEASLPVMEGKALLFKYLGGVDAVPICLDIKDPDEFIKMALAMQPAYGGFNLEDIAQPKCFHILDTLREEARIPVWHDDQQGTAAVTYAGLINAIKIVGKKPDEVKIAMVGAGASNIAISRVMFTGEFIPENVIMCDSSGTLHEGRDDIDKKKFKEKWHMCEVSNKDNVEGGIPEAMKGADVLIALSKPGPDTIKKEWIADMADDAVVFVCANPVPEIWPWEAKEAGASIVATGRSDFPNQVNNSLGFPGIFRGTLDVRATTITDEMCIAAAEELAKCAEDKGLSEDYIIPDMTEWEVFPREATAVALKAIEQGVARLEMTEEEIYKQAEKMISRAREETQLLMDNDIIKDPPEELLKDL
jgi:malate dehydrogenase (oxaloacetate-decarboxylating)